ncbi:tail tape measure protein [Neorhizobium sp. T25_13]|uniref:tail tape measure protein n=1 Tax=Neorhizobium sp. T25_13 TaxID=2093830 RepID=UPI000CF8C9FF|nr:tail tape measure protein [Neorhizobium sp. T25_13]
MAVTDEERLVVSLEARIRDFERNMQKGERTGTRTYQSLRKGSTSATKQMEQDMIRTTTRINQALASTSAKIGDFGKAFAVGAMTAGMAGFVTALKTSVESTAALSRQARMAGMDVERFQELKFAAEQNKIGVDALTDGLKEMQLRADEFVQTGAGSAAESFQRLGYSSEELSKKLKNPSELFVEIIGRMKEFDRAAQIRIGDELFGGSAGERFVELVDKGAEGIREQIRLANELGLVMTREMVAKAEEVDRKFNLVANTIGTSIKSAIIDAVSAWFTFLDSFKEFEKQQSATLEGRQIEIASKRLDLENQRLATPKTEANVLRKIDEQMRLLAEEDARITNVRNGRLSSTPAGPTAPAAPPRDLSGDYVRGYREELAKSNRERAIAAELEKILADASSHGVKLTREQASALAEESVQRKERDDAAKKSASASEKASTASERERERIKEIISELEKEIAVVWQSDEAKRALEASRMAGAEATDTERQRIIDLNEALHQQEEARQRVLDQLDFEKDLTRSALQDMKNALDDGRVTWEEMGDVALNVLDRISDKLMDDVLDSIFAVNKAAGSGGGGGGIFGSLLGGLFSGGGGFPSSPKSPVGLFAKGGVSDKPSIFAEAGPEAAVPLPDGRRIPVDLGNSSGGQMDVKVDVGVTVDEGGNLNAFVRNVSQQQASKTIGQWAGSRSFATAVGGAMPEINKRRFGQ